jgi:hypothetical protein
VTVDTQGSGGDVAVWQGDGNLGLEDIDAADLTVPRMKILHKKALFLDPLKVERAEMTVVMLGVVKQRIFWPSQLAEKDLPLCKSNDHDRGFPNLNPESPKKFPIQLSGFNLADFPPDAQGRVVLPCDKCIFKEWDKNDWKQPPCNEIWAVPLLFQPAPDEQPDLWSPAVLQFSKTGIKPIRQYASVFVGQTTPMFTALTKMTLTAESRGANDYAVPGFSRIGPSPDTKWAEYGNLYQQIRTFIRRDPRSDEAAAETEESSTTTATQVPAAAQSAQAPVTEDPWATAREQSAAAADTSDLPF